MVPKSRRYTKTLDMNNSKSPWSWVNTLKFEEVLNKEAVMEISVIKYKKI